VTVLIAGLVASLVGLGAVLVATRLAHGPAISRPAPPDDPPDPQREPSLAAARAAGQALAQAAVAATQKPQAHAEPATQKSMLTPEEEAARRQLQHEALISEHNAEPASPAWAAKASEAVVSELKSLQAEAGFSLAGVDCRSTSCLAEVEWPSVDSIRRGYHSLLHATFDKLNCATEFHASATATEGPIRTTLVLSKCRAR
jgi:hypothetical protein